jgi:hypothetical protein
VPIYGIYIGKYFLPWGQVEYQPVQFGENMKEAEKSVGKSDRKNKGKDKIK